MSGVKKHIDKIYHDRKPKKVDGGRFGDFVKRGVGLGLSMLGCFVPTIDQHFFVAIKKQFRSKNSYNRRRSNLLIFFSNLTEIF